MHRFWFAAACAGLALFGCRREPKVEDAAPAAPSGSPAGGEAPRAEYHEDTFDLTIAESAPLSVGKPGTLEIRLTAKAGYHPNDKYPYKFKAADAPGVRYASPVLTREAVKLEEKQARLLVDVTPETAGPKSVGGTFSFSLCSAERCLVEKRELAANVIASP